MVLGDERLGYKIIVGENRIDIKVCFDDKVYNASKWTPDPIVTTIPTLFTETITQVAISSILFLLLKPLNQPRVVSEMLAGILVGPSFLGLYPELSSKFFPVISATMLENVTSFGIIYYMFLVGLEMNLTPMLKIDKKTMMNAMMGMILPLAVGLGSYFLIIPPLEPGQAVLPKLRSAFVWAIALSATNLPDLTGILADLKLMRTNIGRTAVASSYVTDITTWFFLAILISISSQGHVLRMGISTLILVLFSAFLARPMLSWIIAKTSKGQDYKETHVQYVLFGVLISAFITDALGLGSIMGAFLFGFSLPSGQLASLITERIGKVMSWVMVPLYCLVNGTKSNVPTMIPKGRSIKHVILFMAFAWAAKVVSIFFVCLKPNMRRPRELVDMEASTVMVVTILVMMMSVPPIIKYVYRPQGLMMRHKIRTIQSTGSESTFRILTCIHSKHEVQGITSLLQMSNPTALSKISAIGVHLVELTDHSSAAMLIMHDTCRTKGNHQQSTEAKSNPVIEAMEEFGRENNGFISVECMTAISRYTTMHVDVCNIAEDKRAAFIILPFHEQGNGKDEPEDIDTHSIRNMNMQVLSNAPCTVGLLVDYGLGKLNNGMNSIIMLFIGGPDDREALTYAWRMVWGPNIHLTVVRFLPGDGAVDPIPLDNPDESEGILNLLESNERQKELDNEFIHEFKHKMADNKSVRYLEEVANSGDETLATLRNVMEKNDYNLCIVGKGNKRITAVESGLSDLIEYQELGAIGDAMVTSEFSKTTSVLVIQHYNTTQQKLKARGGNRVLESRVLGSRVF
ncbi:hypothetical protein CRG98_023053 [Punica granatum]|uniref:Uncharacterized protein n=1 Tax=Punica granatum TaxID=22663 RepID=A0A2I0JJV1_PUNGR|nr:hypothetical protein CRG98_023053 [Punica granatum]